MPVQPYLDFAGRCEEALEFYRQAVDAKVNELMRYGEYQGEMTCEGPAPAPEKIMHASATIGDSMVMASAGMSQGNPRFEGIALTLSVDSDEEAKRRFEALSQDGKIIMPIGPTFFASQFGMLSDRFGVMWMVINTALPQQ